MSSNLRSERSTEEEGKIDRVSELDGVDETEFKGVLPCGCEFGAVLAEADEFSGRNNDACCDDEAESDVVSFSSQGV